MTQQPVTRRRMTRPMKARHLLSLSIAVAALVGCDEGTHSRFATDPENTSPADQLQGSLPDAAVVESVQRDAGVSPPASEPSGPIVGHPGSWTDEIDNTIYWDAATKPTADNVRGVDAGEPDR
jgi:hypothetical protein